MELLSLPDEMVASVLKYTNYTTNIHLRKTNNLINNITKSYDIGTRFPVKSIIFTSCSWFDNLSDLPWKYTLEFDADDLKCHTNLINNDATELTRNFDKYNESHLDIIDNMLKKVTLTETLKIASFCHTIDDSLLAIFSRNRKSLRNMSSFILSITNVSCSNDSARNFIGFARKLRDYRIGYSETSMAAFFQTEMLSNRHWDMITLWTKEADSRFKYPNLNDEFLLKVVKNCTVCTIDMCSDGEGCVSFTVEGVIKLIETLIKEEITPEHIVIESAYTDDYWFHDKEERIQSIHSGLVCKFDPYAFESEEGPHLLITKNNSKIYFPSDLENEVIEFNMCNITQLEERVNDEPMDEW